MFQILYSTKKYGCERKKMATENSSPNIDYFGEN